MNLSELCIRRPVMTVLLCLSVVLAGLVAYGKLPIAALPSYNSPVINVSASPGWSGYARRPGAQSRRPAHLSV